MSEELCKYCGGEGVWHTGIDEAPTTICNKCDGHGTKPTPATHSDDAGRVVESGNPEWLTCAHISSACLSYRHDYGLLEGTEKLRVWRDASKWLRVWMKEVPLVPASDLDAVTAERDAAETANAVLRDLVKRMQEYANAKEQERERLREEVALLQEALERQIERTISAQEYTDAETHSAMILLGESKALATGGRHD